MSDFDFEPVRGLPETLPPGERMLWQGAPDWRQLAIRLFHVRPIAVYFAVLAVWSGGTAFYDGSTAKTVALAALWPGLLGLTAVAILASIAWLIGRTTVYTITSRRLVMRVGVAMPMTVNIPFRLIASAAVKAGRDGSGDIPVQLTKSERIGYAVLWPHARPWRFAKPQPMLRAIPEAEDVAAVLAKALSDATDPQRVAPAVASEPARQRAEQPPLAAAS